MDKNSIIGFVLIAVIMAGFFGYQSHQIKKQKAIQDQLDSIAAVEQFRADSIREAYLAEHPQDTLVAATVESVPSVPVYSDSLLNSASLAEESFYTLSNSKLELRFTTRGAQLASARVKDYRNYDSTDLYLFHEGKANLGFVVFAPTEVDTRKFNFSIVPEESDSTSLVMRLPFSGGGYIEQRYTLERETYNLREEFALVGMQGLIPRNVNTMDVDFEVTMPRMEKGYQNETRYSRLNYYCPGDKKPDNVGNNGRSGKKRVDAKLEWFAFQQQFFSIIMDAPENFASGEF